MQKDVDQSSLDLRRFRANMIGIPSPIYPLESPSALGLPLTLPMKVSGTEPYEEETWRVIRLGNKVVDRKNSCLFDVSCRTVR